MGENEVIKASIEVQLPSDLSMKMNPQALSVLYDSLLTEDDLFGNYDYIGKITYTSILKELYIKISIKLVHDKSSYKLKLKPHEQTVVMIACLKAIGGANEYDKVILRGFINQLDQNITNV